MSSTTNADAGPVARLKKDTEEAYNVCYEQAKPWKAIYYGGRGALILFSALTSAQALAAIHAPAWALDLCFIGHVDHWFRRVAKARGQVPGALCGQR
jgi:hypothetical protein